MVRTAWVYTGGNGKDFVAAMRRLAAGDGEVEMVDDQTGSPTYTGDLVAALLEVADGKVHAPNGIVHAANAGEATRCGQARAVFEGVGADPERVRPVSSGRQPAAGRAARRTRRCPVGSRRRPGCRRCGRGGMRWPRRCRPHWTADRYPQRVSDVLPVVTVTYSPGVHLDRFLASLSHATERPVSVLMADNGSTDGTPQAAVERYPGVRLFSTGSNLGYGSAVNRAVAELGDVDEWIVVANPDVQWGPGSIDALLDAAARWPRAATLGPLIHDPDGSVYPSARELPSLVRGGMHAVLGPLWKKNPWSAAYRQERLEPSERPVGWLSGSCLLVRRAAFEQIGGFDERYFMYMEDVDLGDRLGRAGWLNVYVPTAEVLHHKGHATARESSRNLVAHHKSTYRYLADRHSGPWRAPLRWGFRAGLAVRSRLDGAQLGRRAALT